MNPIIERVFDAIIRIDTNLNIKFVSDSGLRWLGGAVPNMPKSFIDLLAIDDHDIFYDAISGIPNDFSCFVKFISSGKNVWTKVQANYMQVLDQYMICILDIDDFNRTNSAIMFAAEHDALTKLPNRYKLTNLVEKYINSGKVSFIVALLDLDGFKKVNDTLGHSSGDDVLIQTSNRLLKTIDKECDFVARLGGDEFVLILDDATDMERVNSILSKVLYHVARPYNVSGNDAYLGCSIGLASYPEHGDTYPKLLKNADTAMYRSKKNGKNQISSYIHTVEAEDFSIKSAIHTGIQEGEFYIEYQPQFKSRGELKGVEALMRWNSRIIGRVPPDQFITVAEETGLMSYLGEWVLRGACYQLKEFQKHDPEFIISVNVSPVQFANDDFYQTIINVLEETGINPSSLLLEITESTLLKSQDKVEKVLNDLRKKGVKFAIDDFGVGFSSLSYLTQLPVSTIKIDKSFIQAIEHQPKNIDTVQRKLIKAMVSLAHSIDLLCVAEGVEVEHQYEFLKTVNCDYIQGFLLGNPVSPEHIVSMLERK